MKKYFCLVVLALSLLGFVLEADARTYGTYELQMTQSSRSYRGSLTRRSYTRRTTPRNVQVGRNYSGRSRDVSFGRFYTDNRVTYRTDGLFFAVASGSFASDKNNNGQTTDEDDLSETFGDFKLYINNQYVDYVPDFMVYHGRLGVWFDTEVVLDPQSQIMIVGEISRQAETGDKVRFNLRRDGIIGAKVW
jgi:hypothetical protein